MGHFISARMVPLTNYSKKSTAFIISPFLIVTVLPSNTEALDEPKLSVTYSLEAADGGAYFQQISGTPLAIGDVDYVFDAVDSGDPNVDVLVDSPLYVTLEFTADAPTAGGRHNRASRTSNQGSSLYCLFSTAWRWIACSAGSAASGRS